MATTAHGIAGGERVVVQHGADGHTVPHRRTSSVALMSSASESWGCYADAAELARHDAESAHPPKMQSPLR